MKEQRKSLQINKAWTLFLDRDGVINRRIPGDYVKRWEDFEFLPGTLEAIARFSECFGHIFVVTNQQGIGKGQMTAATLALVHGQMLAAIRQAGGRVDKVYFCPDLEKSGSLFRKPRIGMALQARKEFPGIRFKTSLMAGDTLSDMKFGKSAGMHTALIGTDYLLAKDHASLVDFHFDSLKDLSLSL